jgi:hypothetical protein
MRTRRGGRVEKVDGVDAIASASFGIIENVVEDGEAAEVVILADLVCFVSEFRDIETSNRCRCGRILRALRLIRWTDDLSSRSEDDAVGLRIAAVSRIARRVEKVCAMTVIPDDGTSVISTIGVSFCELELSVGVDLRLGTVDISPTGLVGSTAPSVLEFEPSS